MGMIRFEFQLADPSPSKAQLFVEQLRHKALDLPFREVGEIIDVSGDDFNRLDPDDPNGVLLIQCVQYVQRARTHYWLTPTRVIAFHTFPDDGPQQVCFGLAAYPRAPGIDLGTWYWSSICNPQTVIVNLLDSAADLGILKEVREEEGLPDDWFDEVVS